MDLATSDPYSGKNNLGSSTSVDQQLLSSKTQQGCSLEEWQQSSKTFPKSGTYANGRLYLHPAWACRMKEKESLSLPTPMAYSTVNSQPPGQTKLEIRWEQVRLSHEDRSYQPGIREVAFGVPVGVAKGIKGNYDARRAYGLSCSPRQSVVSWKRIDYLWSLLSCQEG